MQIDWGLKENGEYDLSGRSGSCSHLEEVLTGATTKERESVLCSLIRHANTHLPAGTVYEIRETIDQTKMEWTYYPASPYRVWVCWENEDGQMEDGVWEDGTTMKQAPLFLNQPGEGEIIPFSECRLVGRLRVEVG